MAIHDTIRWSLVQAARRRGKACTIFSAPEGKKQISVDSFGGDTGKAEKPVQMAIVTDPYEAWLCEVRNALRSINIPMEDWQKTWPFDFPSEYKAGTTANDAAMKANRFWWKRQNKTIGQDCRKSPDCWLPRGHQGECQPVSEAKVPTYECGDYVKVEFSDEAVGIGEWMWVRVTRCDDEKRLIFGTLDSQPLNDYGGKIRLGSELAVSFDNIRGHKKPSDFESKN